MQSDLFKHIEMFKLNDEYNKFISDMNSLGLVYDFNEESLVNDKNNFTDPSHFSYEVGEKIYEKIFHID